MAYYQDKYCYRCELSGPHINGYCVRCKDRAHREKMAAWNALTVEEKLLDLHKRIASLESKPDIKY